jgi:dTDP-4-amino-4,6-dideoxygalactose transaminase
MALTEDLAEYVLRLDEAAHEVIAPHAFRLVLRDPRFDRDALYRHLEASGVQCTTLFGSLPTQHRAFAFLGHRAGEFPVAEYVGRNGVHFGCRQHLSDDDLCLFSELLHQYFRRF